MTMTDETTTYPETPSSSLYLTCLDLAIRSFHEQGETVDLTERADAFFDALKAKTA